MKVILRVIEMSVIQNPGSLCDTCGKKYVPIGLGLGFLVSSVFPFFRFSSTHFMICLHFIFRLRMQIYRETLHPRRRFPSFMEGMWGLTKLYILGAGDSLHGREVEFGGTSAS